MNTPDLAPPTLAQRVEFRMCWAIGSAALALASCPAGLRKYPLLPL